MTGVGWALVGLAAGFLALALYGKYRLLKEQFLQARAEEEALRRSHAEDEPPIST
jgi:hypothetical protein